MNTAASYRKMACPFCSGHIEYDAKDDGAITVCPHCRQDIELQATVQPHPRPNIARCFTPRRTRKPGIGIVLGVALLCGLLAFGLIPQAAGPDAGAIAIAVVILLLIAAGIFYFLPAFIASMRGHRNTAGIFLLNLFFGWTLIGWVLALIWSVWNDKR
jgi:hypothetical protein